MYSKPTLAQLNSNIRRNCKAPAVSNFITPRSQLIHQERSLRERVLTQLEINNPQAVRLIVESSRTRNNLFDPTDLILSLDYPPLDLHRQTPDNHGLPRTHRTLQIESTPGREVSKIQQQRHKSQEYEDCMNGSVTENLVPGKSRSDIKAGVIILATILVFLVYTIIK